MASCLFRYEAQKRVIERCRVLIQADQCPPGCVCVCVSVFPFTDELKRATASE